MNIVDTGNGPPIVLVPGIQGRWEWMQPAVAALARRCRVITFSLADEATADAAFDPTRGFESYVEQIHAAMDQAQVRTAAVCGVSYGSLIASAFAARHPDRVTALVIVSGVPPSWKPDARVRFFLRAPRLLSPLFCLSSLRLYREIAAATPGGLRGIGAAGRHAIVAVSNIFSPAKMARRVGLLDQLDLEAELRGVRAPVLVLTGEAHLERVVPVRLTREYLDLWPQARTATLPRTGHLGLITRPDEFATLVVPFVEEAAGAAASRRRIG
jgi:pimeloyl-ACP methyl ester carboxylesterase